MRKYDISLVHAVTGQAITATGGKAYVATNGEQSLVATLDSAGSSLTNPVALNSGNLTFYTADGTQTVDLYIQAPSGHFFVAKNIGASGPNELGVDLSTAQTVMVIPFDNADYTAAAETDTGFDLVEDSQVLLQGAGVYVDDADATETIDVGILSSESGGDADGFFDGLSVATSGLVVPGATVTTGSNEVYLSASTAGALLVDTFTTGTDTATDRDWETISVTA